MTVRLVRIVAVVVALGAILGVLAPPAEGHATLVRSSPANDQIVAESPREIALEFDEAVEPGLASITVFDGEARRVGVGKPTAPAHGRLVVSVPEVLPRGTFTVVWRSVSVDGHAINGYFVFHVGVQGANPTGVIGEVDNGVPSPAVRVQDAVARFLGLSLTLIVVGGVASLLLMLRGRNPAVERRLWRYVASAAVVLALVAVWSVVIQAAKVAGSSTAAALESDALGPVLGSQNGSARILQVVAALVVAVAAAGVGRRMAVRAAVAGAIAGAALLTVVNGVAGHAGARGPLAVIVDAVHVAAASVWVGGLATVVFAIVLVRRDRTSFAQDALGAFSRVAVAAVAALILTGAISALVELGGLSHLWSTGYGRLILVKVALAAGLVALGTVSRRRVRHGETGPRPPGRLILTELGIMVVVVAVTTQLVAEPPARLATVTGETQHTVTTTLGGMRARITVTPVTAGPNTVTVALTRDGRSVDVDEVRVAATNTDAGLGPIRAPAVRSQPGTYVAASMPLLAKGEWRVVVSARSGEFDQYDEAFSVTLR